MHLNVVPTVVAAAALAQGIVAAPVNGAVNQLPSAALQPRSDEAMTSRANDANVHAIVNPNPNPNPNPNSNDFRDNIISDNVNINANLHAHALQKREAPHWLGAALYFLQELIFGGKKKDRHYSSAGQPPGAYYGGRDYGASDYGGRGGSPGYGGIDYDEPDLGHGGRPGLEYPGPHNAPYSKLKV